MRNTHSLLRSIFLLIFSFSCKGGDPGDIVNYGTGKTSIRSINKAKPLVNATKACYTKKEDEVFSLARFGQELTCNSQCPASYTVLPRKTKHEIDYGFLAFSNPGPKCIGHTFITQKMNSLGVYCNFDPKMMENCSAHATSESLICERHRLCSLDKKANNFKVCNTKDLSRECVSKYRNLIDDIIKNETPRSIPGFNSLYEFSSHPQLLGYFKDAVKAQGDKISSKSASISQKSGKGIKADVFNEAIDRIKKNQTPHIGIFRKSKNPFRKYSGHAVTGYDTKNINGQEVICVRDPNRKIHNKGYVVPDNCTNYLYLDANSNVKYNSPKGTVDDIPRMNINIDEDRRTENYVNQYVKMCKRMISEKALCYTDTSSNFKY